MATHRSLNKLEYKAHMSIHNVAEVREPESHDSAYTRDRFGRSHRLFEGDGSSRLFSPRAAACAFTLALLFTPAHVWAIPENVRVSTDDLEQKTFNDRLGAPAREEKFTFFNDGSTSAGFNDNGDPNVAMRF